jgi:2-dehydropantoate 2-reductase
VKIAVVGAGAVGSLVGGLLAARGEEVTLVGRPAHVGAIRRHGLCLGGLGRERVLRVKAQERLTERPDLAIFATKAQDLAGACEVTAPLIGGAPVITMQNGVRCDEIALRFFAPEQVVGCVVFSMATFLEPGRVDCRVRGWLTIGDPFVSQPSRLLGIKATLQKALPTRLSADIRATRWTKLIGNLNNALPAITGRPLQEIYLLRSSSRLPLRLMREGLETISRAGIRLDGSPLSLAMRLAARLPEPIPVALFRALARTRAGEVPLFGSTWQSIMRSSPTEIDHLNGEIVALGTSIGHPTPYNARVVRLVHGVEASGRFYPPEELWPDAKQAAIITTDS